MDEPQPPSLPPATPVGPNERIPAKVKGRKRMGALVFIAGVVLAFFTQGVTLILSFVVAVGIAIAKRSWGVIGGYFLALVLTVGLLLLVAAILCGVNGPPSFR